MPITATTNADAFSILRSQAAANGIVLGTLSDVASVALTVANLMGGGGSGVEAGDVTSGTFGSSIPDTGMYSFPSTVGVGGASSAQAIIGLRVLSSVTAGTGFATGIGAVPTLIASANSDALRGIAVTPTFTPGAFTGLSAIGINIGAFSTATFTSPGTPVGLNIGIITGTGATVAAAIQIAPPTGASTNYLIAHTTPATFNVTAAGAMTVGGLITAAASIAATGAVSFTTNAISTTALATPSALAATQFTGFASTVSGASVMGFGTTNDVTLMNRAGTVVLGVTANTTGVTMAGTVAISGALTLNAAAQLGTAAGTDVITIGGTGYGAGAASVRLNGLTTAAVNNQVGTLTNAPTAGNPVFWIPINIAGSVRYIPAWA